MIWPGHFHFSQARIKLPRLSQNDFLSVPLQYRVGVGHLTCCLNKFKVKTKFLIHSINIWWFPIQKIPLESVCLFYHDYEWPKLSWIPSHPKTATWYITGPSSLSKIHTSYPSNVLSVSFWVRTSWMGEPSICFIIPRYRPFSGVVYPTPGIYCI